MLRVITKCLRLSGRKQCFCKAFPWWTSSLCIVEALFGRSNTLVEQLVPPYHTKLLCGALCGTFTCSDIFANILHRADAVLVRFRLLIVLSATVFHITSVLRRYQLTFSKLVWKHVSSLAIFLTIIHTNCKVSVRLLLALETLWSFAIIIIIMKLYFCQATVLV